MNIFSFLSMSNVFEFSKFICELDRSILRTMAYFNTQVNIVTNYFLEINPN